MIFDAEGEVAVSVTPCGCHLPGGGQDDGEAFSKTTVREVREECGLDVQHESHRWAVSRTLCARILLSRYPRHSCF